MPCLDTENTPLPGDTENVLLRKLLNRLCNVTSGGGGGVSQAYVDARDAATLASANANAVAGDVATLAAAMSSASALYVLKSGDTMTGALLLPNGAVGAPSLSHVADANTGLWYPAADTIAFSTAGAERLRILSTGQVGIGTTNPLGRLSVGISSAEAATPVIALRVTDAPTFGFDLMHDTAATGDLYLNRFVGGGALEVIRFQRATGNVGIGIAAPLAKLHITPSASGTDYFRIDHSDGTPRLQVGALPGFPTYAGIWQGNIIPSAVNYSLLGDGTETYLNAPAAGVIYFTKAGSPIWSIPSSGHFLAGTDNIYDIGAAGANRPRNYFGAGTVNAAAGLITGNVASLVTSSAAMNNGAAAALGTLTDAPAAGNPTKWIPIDDNGTTRYIPAW